MTTMNYNAADMLLPESKPVAFFTPDPITNAIGNQEYLVCPECAKELFPNATLTRVFPENIRPYTQVCHRCGVIVHKGTTDVILFEVGVTVPPSNMGQLT